MDCKYKTDSWSLCEGEVTFHPDPFAAEIHDDLTPVWMCEGHRQTRREDI